MCDHNYQANIYRIWSGTYFTCIHTRQIVIQVTTYDSDENQVYILGLVMKNYQEKRNYFVLILMTYIVEVTGA